MAWNVHLPDAEWHTLNSPGLAALVKEVEAQPVVALDTETTGLVIWKDVPLFWSLSWGERRICMPANTMFAFQKAFAQENKDWVFANAKYDCHMLANNGFSLKGRLIDTAVMHALLYEEQPHGLKEMAGQLLGWRWSDFFETFSAKKIIDSSGVHRKESIGEMLLRFEKEDLDKLVEYASNDAYGTFKVYEKLKVELEAENVFSLYPETYATMSDIFYKSEVPFTQVLFECERNGILLDIPFLKSIETPVREKMNKIERKINQLAGRPLNPNSPLQLREYFFETLKVKPISLSKGGKSGVRNPSVDAAFLEHYSDIEMAALLLEHRDLSKLMGTYVEGLQSRVDPGGRVHTRFNQDIARCMPAGELVLTSRGYLPVEKVQVGDLVISHTGKAQKVIETSVHAPRPIYKTTLENGLVLRTTGNHEFAASRWTPAASLSKGQLIYAHSKPEMWCQIPDWAPFEVSSWGRVRNATTGTLKALQIKDKWGHLKVTLHRKGAQKRGTDKRDFLVHKLVLDTFIGGVGETRHLNGIAWDNTLENLCYGTSKENSEDAKRHGTTRSAARLSEEDVRTIRATKSAGQPPSITAKGTWELAQEVRRSFASGISMSAIARALGFSVTAISNIVLGKTWKKAPIKGAATAEELGQRYGVSPVTIRDIWAGRRWDLSQETTGAKASFFESAVSYVEIQAPEITYGLTVEEDHSHVTGGIVTHNTGRLSSSDPNLQNIKNPEDDEFQLRKAFVAKEGHELIVVDYEQLEMRLLAAASLEPKMIDIFARGWDIHMGNAAIVFGQRYGITYEDIQAAKKVDKGIKEGKLPPEAMTDKYTHCLFARRAAKSIGFGLNYGMKENKLARQLGVDVPTAIAMIEEYMATYPAVEAFYADAINETLTNGNSYTLIGRRRYLPEIRSTRKDERWSAERKAVNNQIQGTAADAVRLAMLHCHRAQLEKQFGCKMLLQVHDELVFECPKEYLAQAKSIIKGHMEHPFPTELAVALPVSMGSGANWLQAK